MLLHNVFHGDIAIFRAGIANLFPKKKRFRHALLEATDLRNLIRHPAAWSLDQDMNFLTLLIAEGAQMDFPDLDNLVKDGNWASNPLIKKDVAGESEHWEAQKRKGAKPPSYDASKLTDLARYERNKWVHFNQLDTDLKDLFQYSKQGLVDFCNGLVDDGDLTFIIWEAINCNRESAILKEYWLE